MTEKNNKMTLKFCENHCKSIPTVSETVARSGFVEFGDDNRLFDTFLECYSENSILGTTVNAITDFISGGGLENDYSINRNNEYLSELLQKVVLDYMIHGNATIQVVRNKKGDVAELNYIDVRNCRLSNDGKYVFYSKKWGKYTKDMRKYERFTKDSSVGNSIFWIKSSKSKGFYGLPIWFSSLREVLTMIEASKRNYLSVLNGFTPSTLISFNNGVPSEDVMDELEQSVLNKYTTAEGANVLLTWSDDKEHAPEVSTIQTNDYTERYTTVIESCREAIYSAFRCSPQLIGITTTTTSFNNVEFLGAFSLYKTTVISVLQREIEKQISKLGIEIKFNEFTVDFGNNGEI